MTTETVTMPRALTSENGAKALLSGEFYEEIEATCPNCEGTGRYDDDDEECSDCMGDGVCTIKVQVSWPTIKAIYAKAVEGLAEKGDLPK